ncbi:hypothetical protein DFH29DRAFT_871007 [Suillus ampliporus]|nr:hypothetical protein DFH29DRAFT_871007 [Suillus ampliporus]
MPTLQVSHALEKERKVQIVKNWWYEGNACDKEVWGLGLLFQGAFLSTTSSTAIANVTVKQDTIDHVHHVYVNPDHPVFDLSPDSLCGHSVRHFEQLPDIVRSLTDVTDSDKEPLPLLENQRDLFFHEDIDGAYYMGGIHGGLGLGTVFLGFNRGYRIIDASDHCWLDELAELDESGAHLLPAAPMIEEEGFVVAEFSDQEDDDETYDW